MKPIILTEYFDDLDCHKGLLMGCLFGPGIACPGGDFFIPASNEPSEHAGMSIWQLPRGV